MFAKLLVGNESKDDAAVYDIGDGRAAISTTDFFTPIVDDPFDFGRIAATNALSDIYAMGGTPLMAVAILGWPVEKIKPSIAGEVISGARKVCDNAGIPLAGGHSINSADPFFGLAVTGIIDINNVKRNNKACAGCDLYLTKPLGIGLVCSAEKFGVVRDEDMKEAVRLMTQLNSCGTLISRIEGVKALTDITGFGLAGHTIELAEGSGLTAIIDFGSLPKISGVDYYIEKECMPGGTFRNYSSLSDKIGQYPDDKPISEFQKDLVCDPQTSGGLLIAILPEATDDLLKLEGPFYKIGRLVEFMGKPLLLK